MSKKIEMSPTQATLFFEMKKLAKKANQRIVRLERLTESEEPFGTKSLADYLSSETLQAWTKKGRVAVKKGLSETQMKAIIKKTKTFLNDDISTISEAKKFTKAESEKAGINLSYSEASSIYVARKDYEWIYDYFPGSSYWEFARTTVRQRWSYEKYEQEIMRYITDQRLDETLRKRLQRLYEYSQGVTGV